MADLNEFHEPIEQFLKTRATANKPYVETITAPSRR